MLIEYFIKWKWIEMIDDKTFFFIHSNLFNIFGFTFWFKMIFLKTFMNYILHIFQR